MVSRKTSGLKRRNLRLRDTGKPVIPGCQANMLKRRRPRVRNGLPDTAVEPHFYRIV
nr:MAG TPA: hypothetical protein [Caudoviricetes sp.]